MTMEFPEHPLWDFSLKVYLTEGVAGACVVLQEKHDLDVNILLFCCWLGASGRGELTPAETVRVTDAVGPWNRDVVCAMRGVRRRLKGGMPPAPAALSELLRARIQKIEIDIEHVEQLMLAGAVDRPAKAGIAADRCAADAIANIGSYLTSQDIALDADDRRHLQVLLGVAFCDVDKQRIAELCRGL